MAETGRLEELQRKFDENPRRFFAPLANEYRKGGNIERAIELCREYLPTQPGHMSGYIVYGQALFDGGQHAEAAEAFQRALAVDPENIIALRRLGDIARYAGDRGVAEQWYRRVLEIDPKNEEAVAYLAQLSAGEKVAPAPAAPTPSQTVRPEPAHDEDTVTLGDLVEQPDVPLPMADSSQGAEATQSDPVEAVATLPLITEFTMSARVVESIEPPVELPPVADHTAFEWPAAEPFPSEPTVFNESAAPVESEVAAAASVMFEFAAVETVETGVSESPVSMEPTNDAPVQSESNDTLVQSESNDAPVQNESYEQGNEQRYEPSAIPSEPANVPFVTETMADLYMQQGFTTQALDVYRRLATANDDPRLIEKIQHLERVMMAQSQAASASAPFMTVRDFFARIGARRPDAPTTAPTATDSPPAHGLGALFGSASVDENDARAASVLAGAYPAAH